MKGILVVCLTILMVFALVGCAGTSNTAAAKAAPAATTAPAAATAAPAAASSAGALPAGKVELLDSFEADSDISMPWTAVADSWDQWGAHNYGMMSQESDQGVTDGATSLEWAFETMVPQKNKDTTLPDYPPQATYYTDQIATNDWTDVKYIVLDVFNPNKFTVKMYFSVQATDGWNWSQTKPQAALPGKNTLVFSLDTDVFNGDNPPKAIPGLVGKDQVKRIIFNICDAEKKAGSVFVDNMRIIR